ncbi:MAG TPA: AlkA N-terminal domain-containing protein [Solirubrobacter sp.]|nr:AlkA N-terminal domain-containing protein [Solirubrobacter sp.]
MILRAQEPFDGASLLAFLGARAVPGVEEVVGNTYRRSLPDGTVAEATVRPDGIETDDAALAAVFDLDAPVDEIAAVLGRDRKLRFTLGRRVPGAVDGYEIAVRAVLGQQISVAAAATHAARLVAVAGEPVAEPRGTVTHVFPTAEAIAAAPDSAFAMPARRRETLRSLAGTPLDELITLPGIGPWTQAYVAMRALRDRDAWLPTDLGVRHALARIGHDGDAERWRPFRAYAVMHLWSLL